MPRRLLDSNPQRERRLQMLLLDRIAKQNERRIAADIASTTEKVVKEWQATGIIELPPEHEKTLYNILYGAWNSSIRALASRVLTQGKSTGRILETKQEEFEDAYEYFVASYIETVGGALIVRDIAETTINQIMTQVDIGRRDGLGQAAIAESIVERVGVISYQRAAVIARTETHSAANYGAQQAALKTGLPMMREWIAANQPGRTRDTHIQAMLDTEKNPVGMDEPFKVGQAELMYPGEPNRDYPEETINCRCAVGYIVQD